MEINSVCKRSKLDNNGLIKFINLQSVKDIRDGIENGDIPQWLLFEVLLRLSTKLLFRFKLVSKQWLGMISNPSFVRAYISRASFLPQPWIFILNTMRPGYSLRSRLSDLVLSNDVDEVCYGQFVTPSYIVLPPPGKEKKAIFGVSNGLVLCGLHTPVGCCLYINNPLTRQWIALPQLINPHEWPSLHEGPTLVPSSDAGLGFVTRLEDGNFLNSCRVVGISTLIEKHDSIRFHVFISETGQWNNFTVCSHLNFYNRLSRHSATLNGIVHWIALEHGLIAYDPYQSPDRMRIIAFPSDVINHHRQMSCQSLCDEYEGKLRYFEIYDEYMPRHHFPHISLWTLNDYSAGEWCLLHKIRNTDIRNDTNLSFKVWYLMPLSFHPYDPNVAFLQYDDVLVSYDMKNKRIEVHPKFLDGKNLEERAEWWPDFLLVLPPWPISMPSSFSRAENA